MLSILPSFSYLFPIFSSCCDGVATQWLVEVDAARLKGLRKQRVLTIEQLAEKAGVSKNTISKAERGGSIYPSSIHKIAAALQVDPSELVETG